MNISLVPLEHAASAWNDVRHYLEPAVERCNGRWTMEHLCAAVSMGSTQLWVAFDEEKVWGALTTEVTHYPGKRILSMHFLGGEDFDKWYNLLLSRSAATQKTLGAKASRAWRGLGFGNF